MVLIGTTKITQQGQITLPIEVRQDFNMKAGQRVYVYEEPEGIIISPKANLETELGEEKTAWSVEVDRKLDEDLRKHKAEGGEIV